MNFPTFANAERLGRLLDADNHLPMLITGIAGVAGYNAFAFFRQKYGAKVIGQRPTNNWPLAGNGIVGMDIEHTENLRQFLRRHGFKTIVNCGGSCALKGCELDPSMAHRVNVQSVESLLNAMDGDTRFIQLSIDLVFSGTKGGDHVESDATDPVTIYGKTMVKAEDMIVQRMPQACILRISLPMGISFNGHAGAIDWIQSRFAKGKPATLYYDEVRTPVYVECLNEVIEDVVASNIAGVIHAGGNRKLSLYQIAQIVNLVGGYDPDLLIGCYRMEAGPIPPRAGNVTLDSRILYDTLNRDPFASWPQDPEFIPQDRKWHYRRDRDNCANLIEERLYNRPTRGLYQFR